MLAEVFTRLHREKQFDSAVEGIQAAIRHNQAQPWMYDVLAMEMELAGRPRKDIERALLSRVDFSGGDPAQALVTAAYLSRFGVWDPAMKIYREATERNPADPTAWIRAKQAADASRQIDHIVWVRTGILKHVWTGDYEALHAEARTKLEDLERTLRSSGDQSKADEISAKTQLALQRDLQIRIQWVGDGDVDLSVSEPGGAVCFHGNRRTRHGGQLISTSDGGTLQRDRTSHEEAYVCRKAPSGEYTATARLISGKVVSGQVVMTIVRYSNTSHEQTFRQRVPVADGGMVRISVVNGRGAK